MHDLDEIPSKRYDEHIANSSPSNILSKIKPAYFKVHPVGQIKFIYRFTVRVSRQSLSSLIEQ